MTSFPDPVKSTALVVYDPKAHPLAKAKARMQEMQNLFMEKSFKAQFADYQHFHRHWMGDIIVLVGTSTAGKTSIIKALRQMESDRVEDGVDLRSDAAFLGYFKKQCPDEVAMLEKVIDPLDIPKAVLSPDRPWKVGVSGPEKIDAELMIQRIKKVLDSAPEAEIHALFQNMEPQMFDEAFERSRRGGSIIFDVLNVDAVASHALMRNFDGPMRMVLVYCPFYMLSSRMEKRNKEAEESGNLMNQRMGEFPLVQFSQIYTQKDKGQRALEVITRSQAIKAFDENFDQGIIGARQAGRTLPSDEQILADKVKFRQFFLDDLGFTDDLDKVEIAPRKQHLYHLFINSGNLRAEESAKILHEGGL